MARSKLQGNKQRPGGEGWEWSLHLFQAIKESVHHTGALACEMSKRPSPTPLLWVLGGNSSSGAFPYFQLLSMLTPAVRQFSSSTSLGSLNAVRVFCSSSSIQLLHSVSSSSVVPWQDQEGLVKVLQGHKVRIVAWGAEDVVDGRVLTQRAEGTAVNLQNLINWCDSECLET